VIRKIIAFLLLLIFVFLAPLMLYALNFKSIAFNPDFYKEELRKHNVVDKIVDVIIRNIVSEARAEKKHPEVFLDEGELKRALMEVAPSSWLRVQVEGGIYAFFAWLWSEEELPIIIIPLKDVKGRMPGAIDGFLERTLRKLPECKPGQMPFAPGEEFPSCIPLGPMGEALIREMKLRLRGEMDKFLPRIPDEINLADFIKKRKPELVDNLTRFRRILQVASLALYGGIAAVFVLLILIALFAATSLRSMLRWVGSALFLVGAIALTPAVFLPQLSEGAFSQISRAEQFKEIPFELLKLVLNILKDFVDAFASQIKVQAAIVLGIGIMLIILSLIVGRRR
jgi:hypothetical protein